MIEVKSLPIETSELGSLHITRFIPEDASCSDIGIHFGGVDSRSTTIDTFGVAFLLASERQMIVDVIDRPGNGSSTMPEDSRLREDYRRFGFVAVRDAIAEAQSQDEFFTAVNSVHVSGMSMGGQKAMEYSKAANKNVATATLMDSAGLRLKATRFEGVGRYFLYLGVEQGANLVGAKPRVKDVFSSEVEILAAYENFRDAYPHLPVNPDKTREAKKAEFAELCRLVDGSGLVDVIETMQTSVDNGRHFELRASRSGARTISDNKSVKVINKELDAFDEQNPDQGFVKYGFLQGDNWWHDLAIAPNVVRGLIRTPLERLARRLR